MNIFEWFERSSEVPWVLTSTLFAAALLLFGGLRIRKAVAQDGGVLPDEGFTVRNVFELLIEFLMDLGENTMGIGPGSISRLRAPSFSLFCLPT